MVAKEVWLYDNDTGSLVGGPFVVNKGLSLDWITQALQNQGLWAYALHTPPEEEYRIDDATFQRAIDAKFTEDKRKESKEREKKRKLYEKLKAEFEGK